MPRVRPAAAGSGRVTRHSPTPGWRPADDDPRRLLPDADRLRDSLQGLIDTDPARLAEPLVAAAEEAARTLRHGSLPAWQRALASLPALSEAWLDGHGDTVSVRAGPIEPATRDALQRALSDLLPWRKGPFDFAGVFIDTEWRSDWKWARLADAIQPLTGRRVLDVGCGSGYHLWRMRAAGAGAVLGIDPGLLFFHQFHAAWRYANDPRVQFLPLALEALPPGLAAFDTVFSMGVLYHRRDPLAHLRQLGDCLRAGGELVLETLINPVADNAMLHIDGRYARMRNLWCLPGTACLSAWLDEAGFEAIRVLATDITSTDEQRSTDWMPFESLAEALHPTDPERTIEGYPRPCRCIVLARAGASFGASSGG